MRRYHTIGILRETKRFEHRAPLVPHDVKWLIKRGLTVEVEKSRKRIFEDSEYREAGAVILDRVRDAELLIGIKEPRVRDLLHEKTYMVFSHTAKGQVHNMPLLKECIIKNITLIDYENIVDSHGARLVFFGRFAGICGMVDSLHYLGKKLAWKGMHTPLLMIRPASEYASLKEMKFTFQEVRQHIRTTGFPDHLSPFIVGITGHGSVSRGAQEVLGLFNPLEIHPRNMLEFVRHQRKQRHKLYKIVFLREEKFRSKEGKGFYFEDYLAHPKKFESNLDLYLPYINILIHTAYWDSTYPRLVTKDMIDSLSCKEPFRMEFIGDLSCDIDGSIEITHKATSTDRPTFTYHPGDRRYIDGYKSEGVTVLAVDNLPAELPRDASGDFSRLIRDYVYQIAVHGIHDVTHHMALPLEIRNAVVTQNGRLTRRFSYLKRCIT